MRRRDFIAGTVGAAFVGVPFRAFGQEPQKLRRGVGMLMGQPPGSEEALARQNALREGLSELGWIEGQNLHLQVKQGQNEHQLSDLALQLVNASPDVLVASATTSLSALQRATQTIPIVFAQVTDPVGAGFVQSLARPGGNITGFTQHEFSIGVKWLELLKELAPRSEAVTVLFDPENPASDGYLSLMKQAAPSFKLQMQPRPVLHAKEIEDAIVDAAQHKRGVVVLPGPGPSIRRDEIIALTSRYQVPAVYPFRYWVTAGGLAAYGIDNIDLHRRAALYVDRILKGEHVADLPVQNATKFHLAINLKTARALGLDPPITLLARTDEVIE